MRGKINSDGFLEILCGVEYKRQICPLDPDCGKCGDWCPLFSEPRGFPGYSTTCVDICNDKILEFDEFLDNRNHMPLTKEE